MHYDLKYLRSNIKIIIIKCKTLHIERGKLKNEQTEETLNNKNTLNGKTYLGFNQINK